MSQDHYFYLGALLIVCVLIAVIVIALSPPKIK